MDATTGSGETVILRRRGGGGGAPPPGSHIIPNQALTASQYERLNPPGYLPDWDVSVASSSGRPVKQGKQVDAEWKEAKAWEAAQGPFKGFFMMGVMMWMAGSTVHMFSIGILFSIFWQPISALRTVDSTFKPFEDEKVSLLGPKLLFIALNLCALAAAIWKINTLGLLPTTSSDWLSQLPPRPVIELSVGGIGF